MRSCWLDRVLGQRPRVGIHSRSGAKPRSTPALVATAFPPLNPAKIGKTCPIIAKKPMIRGETSVTPSQIGSRTAKVPLNISTKKVMVPAVLPRTRKVLVVPVFPEHAHEDWYGRIVSQSRGRSEWNLTSRRLGLTIRFS